MDFARFTELGAQIAEISMTLKGRREDRDGIQQEITELETKLRPLIVEHSKMVAEMVGSSLTPPAPPNAPMGMSMDTQSVPQTQGPRGPRSNVNSQFIGQAYDEEVLKHAMKRITAYLETTSPDGSHTSGIGPYDVAEALKMDQGLVREAMWRMASGGR